MNRQDEDSFIRLIECYVETAILTKGPVRTLCRVQEYRQDLKANIINLRRDRRCLVQEMLKHMVCFAFEAVECFAGRISDYIVKVEAEVGEVLRFSLNSTPDCSPLMVIDNDVDEGNRWVCAKSDWYYFLHVKLEPSESAEG